jgi:hypothetical protein
MIALNANSQQQGYQQMAGTSGDQRHDLGFGSLAVQAPGALMGIRLVCEVLDHYSGPDARKLWLIAWAEKANDRTRAGWPTREVLVHRTGRSPSRVSHIAEELETGGVLKRDGGGNRSGPARYILLPLDSAQKSALSPHPKAEVEGAPETHPSTASKGAAKAHPKSKVKGADSPVKGAESGRKGADPKPQPAETGSLPLTIPSTEQPSQEPPAVADAPTAQMILASFIDWVRANGGSLTQRTIGQLARQIGELLGQDIPDRHVRQGLADWYAAGHHAATLDSFVNAAVNAAARGRLSQNGHGPSATSRPATTDQRMADAQALKAKLAARRQEQP